MSNYIQLLSRHPHHTKISDLTATAVVMDPPLSVTTTTTSSTTANKLRLMCSYGGHIIPRSHAKSLYYAGGDTRIISIPTTSSGNFTLSSVTTHLSTTLHISNPFNLKYQLPNHDLDSLISLSTDEDLLIMLEEHHRLSPAPSRIRLFLFPLKPISTQPELTQLNPSSELSGNELRHPKTESWFADVLKSAKIMQKGGVGFGGEGQCESINNGVCGGGEVSVGLCGAESMVLETSSSFGSTSSSVSLSNLPAKGQIEDHGVGLLDNKVKLSASESFVSDNSVATAVSHPQTGTYHDPVASLPAMENKNSSVPLESQSKILDPATGVEVHKVVLVSGFPLSLQFDHPPQIHVFRTAAPHYLSQNPTTMVPVSPYCVMNSPVPQEEVYYQTNQPCPVYFVPVGHPYTLPMQSGLVNPGSVASNRPPVHPNAPANSAQVAYKVAAASPVPEIASQAYRTLPMASSVANVPQNENHQQVGDLPQMNHQVQSIGIASIESTNYSTELDDDLARIQIYKSQPPPPTLPSHHHTMTKASAVLLSEALAQLHTDNIKQQL